MLGSGSAAFPRCAIGQELRVMAAKLVKTETPGIYRRHAKDCDRVGRCECPYVVVYAGRRTRFPVSWKPARVRRPWSVRRS
jgi:hypothetical protein